MSSPPRGAPLDQSHTFSCWSLVCTCERYRWKEITLQVFKTPQLSLKHLTGDTEACKPDPYTLSHAEGWAQMYMTLPHGRARLHAW